MPKCPNIKCNSTMVIVSITLLVHTAELSGFLPRVRNTSDKLSYLQVFNARE